MFWKETPENCDIFSLKMRFKALFMMPVTESS